MKEFTELPPSIQLMLEDAVQGDPYGLSPVTLYRNIVGSLAAGTSLEHVAQNMEVSLSLVQMILDEQE